MPTLASYAAARHTLTVNPSPSVVPPPAHIPFTGHCTTQACQSMLKTRRVQLIEAQAFGKAGTHLNTHFSEPDFAYRALLTDQQSQEVVSTASSSRQHAIGCSCSRYMTSWCKITSVYNWSVLNSHSTHAACIRRHMVMLAHTRLQSEAAVEPVLVVVVPAGHCMHKQSTSLIWSHVHACERTSVTASLDIPECMLWRPE